MEPIKFEDNIREKLQEREIMPSENAWKKLHSKLDPRPNKNNNRLIWFAVAASFIGILIIASLLFKEGSVTTNTTDFVVENPEKIDDKEADLIVVENTNGIASKETKPIEKREEPTKQEPEAITKNTSDLAEISSKSVEETTVASNEGNSETATSLKTVNEELLIDSKVDEVVAQIQVLQKDNNSVDVEEINALLLKAQRDIQARTIFNVKNKKVDATALLNAVEDDIEISFRDKVFEALGDGYDKVKTAVVERNN